MNRPSLPGGYSLSASKAVEKALYVSDEIEVYAIQSSTVTAPEVLALSVSIEGLREWWASLEGAPLAFKGFYDHPPSLKLPIGAFFETSGTFITEHYYRQITSSEVREAFEAVLDSALKTAALGLIPSFAPGLTWAATEGVVTSLLPTIITSEEEGVRKLASAFYRLLTGIDVSHRTNPAPLSQWFRNAGPEISRILSDCLLDEKGKQKTRSFAKLESDLGRTPLQSSASILGTSEPERLDRASGLAKVAGMHSLKQLLLDEVVGPVRNPERFRKYGLSVPNGILLYGPPGCGKTYIARALAEELGHHFVEIVPSELASPYVHGSVIRIREVFDEAAANAPAVVFIDEFEALAPNRSDLGGFQQHKAEEVNEILTHLNGASERKIFVVAATNRPELIDPAIRRTGRLDKLIYVSPPDREAREEMLRLHLAKRPVSRSVDLPDLSQELTGYSASDIKFLVDEAARDALIRNVEIDEASFRRALSRITPSIPPETELLYQSIEQRGLI
ncbi:MAG: ATP-binding protein [Acidobacteria bacterium]|nr:ATP-binding protein [Acidobacteriota bacterium]